MWYYSTIFDINNLHSVCFIFPPVVFLNQKDSVEPCEGCIVSRKAKKAGIANLLVGGVCVCVSEYVWEGGEGGFQRKRGVVYLLWQQASFWKPVLTGQGSLDCSMYSENSFPVNQARSGHD